MKTFLKISSVLMIVMMTGWAVLPMTSVMRTHPRYYLWSRGFISASEDIHAAFTRDTEHQKSLMGQPIEALRRLFPDMQDGTHYSADSYRGFFATRTDLPGRPITCYWLMGGTEDDWGYCAIVRQGRIMDFQFVKG